eukprot:Hpha_TRINITY_DN15605_c1_g2::TRINITY_DN15605_c1_g2_i1::g.100570::m.100570
MEGVGESSQRARCQSRLGQSAPPPFDDGESPPPAPRPCHEATVHALLSKGQEAEERKRRRKAELATGSPYPFSPRLNPDSLAAADRLPRRPLHEPIARFAKRGATPREKPLPQSARLVSSPEWQDDFIRRNKLLAVKRAERVKEIEKSIAEQELTGCTFAPTLCRASDAIRVGAKKRETSPMPRVLSPQQKAKSMSPSHPSPSRRSPPRGSPPRGSPVRTARVSEVRVSSSPPTHTRRSTSPPTHARRSTSPPARPRLSPPRRPLHTQSPPRPQSGDVQSPSRVSATEREVQRVLAEWNRVVN